MTLDGARAGLADRQPDLVKQRLVHPAAPGHRRRDQPGRPDVRGQRGEAQLDCCHFGLATGPGGLLLSPAGRDGLVDGVVDAEYLGQARDPEDLQDPLLGAHQVE